MEIDAAEFRRRLLERKAELERLSESTDAARKPVELDQSSVGRLSRMDAMQVQAMALETERRRSVDVQRIAAAIKRIDTDDFGYCLSCGDDIALPRLEADPAVTLCLDCAKR